MAGEELVAKYQTIIFLAGSASAEFFADMALSPFEAVKVRVVCVWLCCRTVAHMVAAGWCAGGSGGRLHQQTSLQAWHCRPSRQSRWTLCVHGCAVAQMGVAALFVWGGGG
jgi:hypothetical protein